MNETIFYTLAEVAMALAGFSGFVAAFRLRGENAWSSTELRILSFLIIDSLLVVFLSLLPVLLHIGSWDQDTIWTLCSSVLGLWFIVGNFAFRRGRRKRISKYLHHIPNITLLLNGVALLAVALGVCLWLSAFDILIPRGQAVYTAGLLALLAFAAIEFLFFVGRAATNKPR